MTITDCGEQAFRLGAFGLEAGRGGPGCYSCGRRIFVMVLGEPADRRRGARIQRQTLRYHRGHGNEGGVARWQTKAGDQVLHADRYLRALAGARSRGGANGGGGTRPRHIRRTSRPEPL